MVCFCTPSGVTLLGPLPRHADFVRPTFFFRHPPKTRLGRGDQRIGSGVQPQAAPTSRSVSKSSFAGLLLYTVQNSARPT